MNTVRVSDMPLNLIYTHSVGDNRTTIDGTFVFDSSNKISANHVLGSGNCKMKYNYLHGGVTTFEPVYDLAKNSWDFAVSRRVYGDDVLRASYQTSSKNLGLEWTRNSKFNGAFKAIMHQIAEVMPKLSPDLINIMDRRILDIEYRTTHLQRLMDQPEASQADYSRANKELRKLRESLHVINELRAKQKVFRQLLFSCRLVVLKIHQSTAENSPENSPEYSRKFTRVQQKIHQSTAENSPEYSREFTRE